MENKLKMVGGIKKSTHNKFHEVLIERHGNASKCEMPDCKSANPKRFEWALKKGHQYSNKPEDYIQLCPSCHRKYDFTEDIRTKLKAKKQGENNNRAILTNEAVIKITALIKCGHPNKEIAELFGVKSTIISNIKTGKRWGSLTGIKWQKTKNYNSGTKR